MKLPDLHDKKTQLALGGAGAVVAFALYRKHAAAASSGTTSGTSTTDSTASQAFDASSIENNVVGDLQPEIDTLAGQISGLGASSPKPPPPTTTKTPAPKPPPTAATPTNSATFPVKIPSNGLPGDPLVDLGVIGAGGVFTGQNVKGGAPVYAIEGNVAVQNFDPKKLPAGTHLATLKKFASSIVPGKVTEKL